MQSNFKKIIEFHKAFGLERIKSLEYIIIYIISLKYI
jgi:hypothetical protein